MNDGTNLCAFLSIGIIDKCTKSSTAKNTVISPDFFVWKFGGKAQFPNTFGQIARNYPETLPFHKISAPGNQMKLRYFCNIHCLTWIKLVRK